MVSMYEPKILWFMEMHKALKVSQCLDLRFYHTDSFMLLCSCTVKKLITSFKIQFNLNNWKNSN